MHSTSIPRRCATVIAATWLVVLGGPSCADPAPERAAAPVDVALRSANTPAFYTTDLGYRVEIEAAYLSVTAIELVPCPSLGLQIGPLAPRARAHTTSTPVRSGEPQVVDLMGSLGLPVSLGTLTPPSDIYCSLELTLAPADVDAAGLAAAPEMEGQSLMIEALITPSGGSPVRLTLAAEEVRVVGVPFATIFEPADDDPIEEPIRALRVDTDHLGWLDGVTLDAAEGSAVGLAILDNVVNSFGAEEITP